MRVQEAVIIGLHMHKYMCVSVCLKILLMAMSEHKNIETLEKYYSKILSDLVKDCDVDIIS